MKGRHGQQVTEKGAFGGKDEYMHFMILSKSSLMRLICWPTNWKTDGFTVPKVN